MTQAKRIKRDGSEIVGEMLLRWLVLNGKEWVRAEDILPSDPSTEWMIVTREDLVEAKGSFTDGSRRYRLTPKSLQIINHGL